MEPLLVSRVPPTRCRASFMSADLRRDINRINNQLVEMEMRQTAKKGRINSMRKTLTLISCLIVFVIRPSQAQDVIMVEPGKPCPMTGLRQDGSLPDQAHQQQDL